MTSRTALLDYADQILAGHVQIGSAGPRTAALLARCALEDWLDQQCASWPTVPHSYPSTRSKLVALTALGSSDDGQRAQRAWNALSRAMHHHSYELQPSLATVRDLVGQVRALGQGSDAGSGAGPAG
ncbi:hypothetical protein KIH27_17910 [Mycobacterium sp. M1]|uniref:DUF222 domain-containing protein n=1 Tax=Mycolicibacter acidiphilus TaxID=2835306 RepID=A0ABS5RPE6_9MYCO|nr:hypothetical protein [Mycolicibacter acidiphilus]MBS9535464.1 hypothetical protein [Mycolicibacter acidiphilus]